MSAPGWWRRNRWGLVALPVALAAALTASSYRVEDQWWLTGSRVAVRAEQGVWAEFSATLLDRTGDVPITLQARLDEVRPAEVPFGGYDDELSVPPGAQALAVVLDFQAEPDVPLVSCRLSLVDAEGTEYAYQLASPTMIQASSPCVPPDERGPELDLIEGLDPDTGPRRPDEWTVQPVVVVPEGVEIVEVRLTWAPPRYLAIRLSS